MRPDELNEQEELAHAAARAAVQADADGRLSASQRQELEQHLAACRECRAYQAEQAALQARLQGDLQARWPARPASSADIAAALGNIQSRARRQSMFKSGLRTFVGASAVLLFVLLLSWSIRALLPQPGSPGGVTPSAQLSPAATQEGPAPVTPTPLPPADTPRWVGLFPETEFTFAVALPEGPQQAQLYRQVLSEALTADNARQMAARLGITGEPRATTSEAAWQTIYEVSNGYDLARFINSPANFVISRAAGPPAQDASPALSEQAQIAAAEAFLQPLGLLELPYQASINPRGEIEFAPLLEERRVLYGIGDTAGAIGLAKVAVDPGGQVSAVYYSQQTFEALGSFPILSAAQAWERLSSGDASARSMFAVLATSGAAPYQQWGRTYPTGQRLDLYGNLQVATPPGGESQMWIYGYAIANEAALAAAPAGQFLHIWGQLETDTAGRSALNVAGWEVSTAQEEYLPGTIRRQGEQVTLQTDDGRSLRLPDAPADLADGDAVFATGVLPANDPASLQWRLLEIGSFSSYGVSRTCGGGGGGGGGPENANFGGGAFGLADVLLAVATLTPQAGEPATPTPIPPPGPLAVGQEIAGIQGVLNLYQHRYADGRQALEGGLYVEPGNPYPEPLSLLLEGPGLLGAEPLQNLPVTVWGQVVELRDGVTPVVAVTRLEATYPGLRIQAWMGIAEVVTVEGQEVLLFSAQDGNAYILKHSIDCGSGCLIGLPGDTTIYEGYPLPGQTFGGYPLLMDLSGGMGEAGQDLSNYPLSSLEIGIWDDAGGGGPGYNPEYMHGQVTIDQIELAYAAVSLESCANTPETLENFGSWLIVQPVWIFSGHFEDGRIFTIQVQALPD